MNSAVYSLAMREHSRLEIKNKLKRKEFSENVDLDVLIDELEEKNYLCEKRFTESFIRYRASRGQGRNKIINELRHRGITAQMISLFLRNAEIDWYQIAKEQREKKFGCHIPNDYKEKSRQMRFLFGRGFDTEIIRATVG